MADFEIMGGFELWVTLNLWVTLKLWVFELWVTNLDIKHPLKHLNVSKFHFSLNQPLGPCVFSPGNPAPPVDWRLLVKCI